VVVCVLPLGKSMDCIVYLWVGGPKVPWHGRRRFRRGIYDIHNAQLTSWPPFDVLISALFNVDGVGPKALLHFLVSVSGMRTNGLGRH